MPGVPLAQSCPTLPLGLCLHWQPAPDLLAQAVGFYLARVSSAGHTNPVGVRWTGPRGSSLWGAAWVSVVGWSHAGLPPLKPASLAHYPSLSCLSPNATLAFPQTLTLQNSREQRCLDCQSQHETKLCVVGMGSALPREKCWVGSLASWEMRPLLGHHTRPVPSRAQTHP